MLKPTPEELDAALTKAGAMREQDQDGDFLARSLLFLTEKADALEKIASLADLYINHGQLVQHHTALVMALEQAKRKELFEHRDLLR